MISEADAEYAQAIRLQPTIALAHLNRGVTLARLSHLDEAALEFQETLRLDPGSQRARQCLDRVSDWKVQQH